MKKNIPYFTRFCNRLLFIFPLASKGEIRYIKFMALGNKKERR